LRWLIEQYEEKGSFFLVSDDGRVPLNCIQFAISRCKDFIDYCLHNDIDIEGDLKIWEHDWDVFLTHHYLLTHESTKFQMQQDAYATLDAYVDSAKRILEKIKILWPQYGLDGTLNIWIIKPGNKVKDKMSIELNGYVIINFFVSVSWQRHNVDEQY
jgi:tubulin monoglycylase TTLL3/8